MTPKYQTTLCALAASIGIRRPRIETGRGRHPKLVGLVGNREIRRAVAGSPGDYRALLNLRSELKRLVEEMRA